MKRSNLLQVALLGTAGAALGTVSVEVGAVTADDVVCNGCVQSVDVANGGIRSVDIKNYDIRSLDIYPDLTLGRSTQGGRLGIRTTNDEGALIFEADGASVPRSVRIGRGGAAATNEDTDLLVIDPDFSTVTTEPVMEMNASTGTLILGSGSGSTPGESGELYIENGSGTTNIWVFGTGQAYLGNTGSSGTLYVDNGTASWNSIVLAGSTSSVTNQFNGNGIVKAWARINADGAVASCYRCNGDTGETRLISGFTGAYEVDFTPVGTDISGRPWTCSLGNGATFGAIGQISCVTRSGDASSIFIDTRNTVGDSANLAFTVVVY